LTRFETSLPEIKSGQPTESGEKLYLAPVKDFSLAAISLRGETPFVHVAVSPEIVVVISGSATIDGGDTYYPGDAFYVSPTTNYTLSTEHESTLFRAFVP
jgi:mannose-6-phosphate isomerase class I